MTTVISYETTDSGITLYFTSDSGAECKLALDHEERKSLGFFLLEIQE